MCKVSGRHNRLPFRAEDTMAILLKQMQEPLPDITALRPDVPPSVIELLDHMTEKNPDDRPLNCAILADEISTILKELQDKEDLEHTPNLATISIDPSGKKRPSRSP